MIAPEQQLDDLTSSTVMVVDDEPTIIDVMKSFLEGEGYHNLVATSDSRRALELLQASAVDLLLLDLNMPHVDGFEILEAIRASDDLRHTPVIILTSDTSSETKLKALELGATDFLGKPVDPSELALRLRNTLAAKAYRDRLAYYDLVTGLPNRMAFIERTGRALRRARHYSHLSAVLHISVGQFERINDTLGHDVGDELLRSLALRLENCVRSSDVVGSAPSQGSRALSRVGGGEFALFLPAAGSTDIAANLARRMIAAVEEPLILQGEDLFVSCSVGIALAPGDGDDPETLLRHARMANGKQETPDGFAFYSRAVNVDSLARLSLENQLRRALERDEMVLHYQPQLDIQTGRILGTEALMRWEHPDLGLVLPQRFIPIAEETGIISE
ncbi:MAG: diguanylate cyclase domain-containing protein, partial [Myxococcota bacterium]